MHHNNYDMDIITVRQQQGNHSKHETNAFVSAERIAVLGRRTVKEQ